MVTSNKVPDKKVVKMVDHSNSVVVPQRTLLGEVNEHITCPLCRGYYIDATTIVECLHSFCKSCIIKHLKVKSYCPVCEMMINSAKPNIKHDKALQDIVYKLVPGLFHKEMERRQTFFSSRPEAAATATPEQRGEDTERIIFSPEDVISFSLEYADATDSDSISSKSSDSNEPLVTPGARRYLQCPAVVNISHLKKFLSMKFDIDSTQYVIDILYKRVPLPGYYTLMDIAYIYNWKRNEPLRFFYQIIDYAAIRNRIFEINRECAKFSECKGSLSSTEDLNRSSPAPQVNDQASEASSGTTSPMPDENTAKDVTEIKQNELFEQSKETFEKLNADRSNSFPKKNEEDVEKSQFLNSFELAPKSTSLTKTSPSKATTSEEGSKVPPSDPTTTTATKSQDNTPKPENKPQEPLKRKYESPATLSEMKKLKIELEKTKINEILNNYATLANSTSSSQTNNTAAQPKESEIQNENVPGTSAISTVTEIQPNKEIKKEQPSLKAQQLIDGPGIKRNVTAPQSSPISKQKPINDNPTQSTSTPVQQVSQTKSPIKNQVPKTDQQALTTKTPDVQKPTPKKMPDLKPTAPPASQQHKAPSMNKMKMESPFLLANNSDPTIDRSKILSQVKTSLSVPQTPSPGPASGDPLKSLFDSCKINIPSSLSITLFDQKIDPRNLGDSVNDSKNSPGNKNQPGSSSSHKVSAVPNYIEIMKLPDTDTKKPTKVDGTEAKASVQNKNDATGQVKPPTKSSDSPSAKGPVPNLKPIAETKSSKQTPNANFIGPITFQQTFEQQLLALQNDKKIKVSKNKSQIPNLVLATPKLLNAANNKPTTFTNKPNLGDNKASTALDLSSPNSNPGSSGTQQTFDKTFEAMQSIANLAKKQSLPPKVTPPPKLTTPPTAQSSFPSATKRTLPLGISPLRVPAASNINQVKLDKVIPTASQMNIARQETINKSSLMKQANNPSTSAIVSVNYQIPPSHASTAQPSPRQTRSPSSSPKLVIAEEKQVTNTHEQSMNQSNQISSTQLSSTNAPVSPIAVAGPSKPGLKSLKPFTQTGPRLSGRQPITPTMRQSTPIMRQSTPTMRQSTPNMPHAADYLRPSQFMAQQAMMRHQMEMSAAWMKAQRQYDFDLFKNMRNIAHQAQNERDKQ